MPRSGTGPDEIQGDVLISLYELPGVPSSTYTLTEGLNPGLQVATPEYRTAFAHVSSAVEEHIVLEMIRGKRSKGDDGVYFENLKLTTKGERAAILELRRRALPGEVKKLMDVAEAIRERRDAGS